MPKTRKNFTFTENETDKLRGVAAAAGMTTGEWLTGMLESFVEVGSDFQVERTIETQVMLDSELVAAAEEKAGSYGTTLRNILRFEIAELDKL